MSRFKVFAITNGGWCVPVYVNPTAPKREQVQERDGEPIHPYEAGSIPVCPHCTSKRNWTLLRRLEGKGQHPRVTRRRTSLR